jgi:hypothetical protein
MAIWWLKVAEELEELRKRGIERPYGHIPDVFSGKSEAPTIETTHRVVVKDRPVALIETPKPAEPPRTPDGVDGNRFRDNERLVDNGRSESFLKRPVKKAGRWV